MALFIRKFGSRFEAQLFMQGGLSGGLDLRAAGAPNADGKHLFLHGLTLITTGAFAGTITFVASPAGTQVPMSVQQMLAQIDTQSTSALKAGLTRDGRLYLIDAGVPTAAVVVTGTGTANAILGFPDSNSSGTFYNPSDGIAPRVLNASPAVLDSSGIVILTEET